MNKIITFITKNNFFCFAISLAIFLTTITLRYPYQYYTNLLLFTIPLFLTLYNFKIGIMTSLSLMSLFTLTGSSIMISYNLLFADTTRIMFFLTIAFYILLYIKSSPKINSNYKIEKITYFYVATILIYAVIGILKWPNKIEIINEIFLFSFWLIPLIMPKFLDKKYLKYYSILLTFVIMLQNITYLQAHLRNISNFPDNRIYTRQINIFLYIYPFIYSLFYFEKNKKIKLIYLFIVIFSLYTVIISQTRASLMLMLFSSFLIHILNKNLNLKNIIKYTLLGIISFLIFIIFLKLILSPEVFKSRFDFLNFYKDFSFLLRVIVAYYVINNLGWHLLIGEGLGNIFQLPPGLFKITSNFWVDIGYLSILGKTGIIGLILIFTIFFKSIKHNLSIYKNKNYIDKNHKILVFAVLSSAPAMIVQNFLTSVLIKYLYIIFYFIILAWGNYYYYIAEQKKLK